MSAVNPQPPKKEPKATNDNSYENFLIAKNSLIRYYTDVASSQTVRLLGFTAGIFTLLGITQITKGECLQVFAGDFATLLNFGIADVYVSFTKLVLLFIPIFILTFFSFRAIFRYAAFALIANEFIYVRFDEIENNLQDISLHHKINNAMLDRLARINNPKKLYGVISIRKFICYSNNKEIRMGYFYSIIFALCSTSSLLLLVW